MNKIEIKNVDHLEVLERRSSITGEPNSNRDTEINNSRIIEEGAAANRASTKPIKSRFIYEAVRIRELAGDVFRELREMDNISSSDVIRSLSPEENLEAIKNAGES